MLKIDNIQLLPFSPEYADTIHDWFYDTYYKNFFRHIPRLVSRKEFQEYGSLVLGNIYMLVNDVNQVVGMIHVSYDNKTNRGIHLGLLVDKSQQGNNTAYKVFREFLKWMYDTAGIRKVTVEILAKHSYLVKLLESTGFEKEATLKQECFLDGEYVDELRYCMFRDQFIEVYNKGC